MKQCDQPDCENVAKVHLTKVVNGEVKKVHLCSSCAQKSGVDLSPPESIPDLLQQFGDSSGPILTPSLQTCPACGMDQARFKKRGRLGCGSCYGTFSSDLLTVIQSMHHSAQHLGKIPAAEGLRSRFTREMAVLNEKLSSAILHEQYEEAASLRDQIRTLKAEGA